MTATLDQLADGITEHVVATALDAEDDPEEPHPQEIDWRPQIADLANERVSGLTVSDQLGIINDYDSDGRQWTDLEIIERHSEDGNDPGRSIQYAASSTVMYEVLDRLAIVGLQESWE